jgi:hypothetical protein
VTFVEPDIVIKHELDGRLMVHVKGVDVFDPTTGEVRSDGPDGIALNGVTRLGLIALCVAKVQADDRSNRRQNRDGNEEERKHQRSNPNATPRMRHGPAMTTIATTPLRVNRPCVTRNAAPGRAGDFRHGDGNRPLLQRFAHDSPEGG